MTCAEVDGNLCTILTSADGKVYVEKKLDTASDPWADPGGPVICRVKTNVFRLNNTANSRFVLYNSEVASVGADPYTLTMRHYIDYSSSALDAINNVAMVSGLGFIQLSSSELQVYAAQIEALYEADVGDSEGTQLLQIAMVIGVQDGLPKINKDYKG
jgi:hypothetical protein